MSIVVSVKIAKSVEEVWQKFTASEHIVNWNFASDDWHCPSAISDFKETGTFSYTMSAKHGSFQFDLKGTFNTIILNDLLSYTLEDGRQVQVKFLSEEHETVLVESFEPENLNSEELQKAGWQAILDNFKKYCEKT